MEFSRSSTTPGTRELGVAADAAAESSSSEGDMTWEDFLASTDEPGDAARAAAVMSQSMRVRQKQTLLPPTAPPRALPPGGARAVAGATGGSALERRPTPPQPLPPRPQPPRPQPPPPPLMHQQASLKGNLSAAGGADAVGETGASVVVDLIPSGESRSAGVARDGSAPDSGASDAEGEVGGEMKQVGDWLVILPKSRIVLHCCVSDGALIFIYIFFPNVSYRRSGYLDGFLRGAFLLCFFSLSEARCFFTLYGKKSAILFRNK